jgi:glycosyltransferase involved in cell wall biosynthesis
MFARHLSAARPNWNILCAVDGRDLVYESAELSFVNLGHYRVRGRLPNAVVRGFLWPTVRLGSYARRTRPDLIWSPAFYLAQNVTSIPKAVSIWDLRYFSYRRWWPGNATRAALAAASIKQARIVHVPTQHVARSFHQIFPTRDRQIVEVIPLGVAIGPDEPSSLEGLDLPERFFLAVGAQTFRNNGVVSEALDWLADRGHRTAPLVIVGGTEAAHRSENGDRTIYLGAVSDAQLWTLYRRAIAVCIGSTFEGFGLPAAEAMALGTPVVGSDAGALPEVIGDGGLLVPPLDVRAWAKALLEVTNETIRKELGVRASRRALDYSWESSAAKLAELFELV